MRFTGTLARLCLLATCSFFAAGCNTPPAENSAVPDIQKWMADWTTAFQSKDEAGMAALYAPGLVAYDIVAPLQYAGKDAYMKDWHEFFTSFQGPLTTEFKDCHISSSGDLAYALCLERLAGTSTKGEKIDMWLRVTSIFHKEDGKWLDIHDHVSVPADMASGKAVMDLKP